MSGAAPQAGVFGGLNPTVVNPNDPLVLFIIQATIILVFCRLLAIPLGWIRQPRVISEVIAGIILGPSVMGRIPGFQNTIFPTASIPFLSLIANLGLVFFLFQVGLEVDLRIVRQNWTKGISVAVAGMVLPFGLGAAVSVGLYKLQNNPDISFGSFLLFLGVSMSITASRYLLIAFPVLARILAELKLLRTKVGAITMAAGLLNDCSAWVLLALVVALVNAMGGLEALWVLLTAVGFALFLLLIVGPLYRRLATHTGSIEHGPTPLLMTVTLLIVLISAFVTDIIGVHPIFGGFLAGIIVPHEGDLAIKITEKIEDIVNIIFLPLYFTLSGLQTQIGLLNTGTVWGYVILVIVVACVGKITGCTIAARVCGMTTRESFTVGFLMNCKGLVELIVLNIGHNAGVLNDQVFVIMIVMALVTTFMTTPVVMWLYPEWYQKQQAEIHEQPSEGDLPTLEGKGSATKSTTDFKSFDSAFCLVTMLNRIDHIPSVISLLRLLKKDTNFSHKFEIHVLRLLELTQRTSDVMKIQDIRETERRDPILNVLRTFSDLVGVHLKARLEYCAPYDFVKTVFQHSQQVNADMILLPWHCGAKFGMDDLPSLDELGDEGYFVQSRSISPLDYELAMTALNSKSSYKCTVGLFIDRGFSHGHTDEEVASAQIIVPYLGGADDQAALMFALRLHADWKASVKVIWYSSPPPAQTVYASDMTIQQLVTKCPSTDADIFETLFNDTHGTHAISCEPPGISDTHSSLTAVGKETLIVVGRRTGPSSRGTPAVTPNEGTVRATPNEKELKHVLGPNAFEFFTSASKANIMVVQSPSRT